MHSLAMINQKGGCGKTTTAINLSSALAERGHKVLLVDMDPQAHATLGLGVNPDFLIESICDVLGSPHNAIRDIAMPVSERLDLAPSKFSLALIDQLVADRPEKHRILRRALEPCEEIYDFAVIDCPPNVGTLTLNALGACNEAMAILETSFFSLHGISRLLETLGAVRKTLNPDISVSVVATMYDKRTRFARDVLEEIRTHFGSKLYSSVVRTCVSLREAASAGLPIHSYDPKSHGSADYLALADEVAQRRAVSQEVRKRRHAPAEVTAPAPSVGRVDAATSVNAAGMMDAATSGPAAASGDPAPPAGAAPLVKFAQGPARVAGGVLFTLEAPNATDVRLIGDFNNWDPASTRMAKQQGTDLWTSTVPLEDGRFEYRFLVDGDWMEDPENPHFLVSEYGGRNSVAVIGEAEEAGTSSPRLGKPDPARDEERPRAPYGL